MGPRFLLVDPRTLRLPPTRLQGADPSKLQRQIARYGRSVTGMPRLEVIRDPQGELMITDGVTRATRIAKLSPGTVVSVEVTGENKKSLKSLPLVSERLP